MATEPIDLDLLPDVQAPGIAATPPPSGAASSAGSGGGHAASAQTTLAATVATAPCYFECGPPYPITQLTNMGNARCVRWVCNPCNNARKAIECASRKDSTFKKQVNEMRTHQSYQEHMRKLRIADEIKQTDLKIAEFVESLRTRRFRVVLVPLALLLLLPVVVLALVLVLLGLRLHVTQTRVGAEQVLPLLVL